MSKKQSEKESLFDFLDYVNNNNKIPNLLNKSKTAMMRIIIFYVNVIKFLY